MAHRNDPLYFFKAHDGVELTLHSFLIWERGGSEWLTSSLVCFASRGRSLTAHRIVGRVGPKADLESPEKRHSFCSGWESNYDTQLPIP